MTLEERIRQAMTIASRAPDWSQRKAAHVAYGCAIQHFGLSPTPEQMEEARTTGKRVMDEINQGKAL